MTTDRSALLADTLEKYCGERAFNAPPRVEADIPLDTPESEITLLLEAAEFFTGNAAHCRKYPGCDCLTIETVEAGR